MQKTKILIVDDHTIVNQALANVLSDAFEVIGAVKSGEEALESIEQNEPDVILLDLCMQGLDGFETANLIKAKFPGIKVIIMSAFCDDTNIIKSFGAKINGYILKDISIDRLITAIRVTLNNDFILSDVVAEKMFNILQNFQCKPTKKDIILSPRETEIIKLVSEGKTNAIIANSLFISEKTVKNHLQNIFKKLQAKDRAESVAKAIKFEII